ncbi:MAG: type IV pilus secretin PilQ [Bdellovibrionales bacterium]|nr:type IV pilus secretin PilQ [Bdellovibrionales bacterium]
MAQKLYKIIWLVLILGLSTSCSSPSSKSDDDVLAALEDVESGGESEPAEFGSDEEVASNEEGIEDEIIDSEDFGGDEVMDSSDESADDIADSEPAEEDFGSEEEMSEEPEQMAETQSMENEMEEPLADEMAQEEAPFEDEPVFAEEPGVTAEPMMAGAAEAEVTDIEYRSNEQGGAIVIKTSAATPYTTRLNPETNQFVVEIQNVNLADRFKRPYIMKDFGAAFKAINAYQNPGTTTARVVIQMQASNEPLVQQEGHSIIVIPQGEMSMAQAEAVPPAEDAAAVAAGPSAAPAEADSFEDDPTWRSSYDTQKAEEQAKILGARTLDEFMTESNEFFGRRISIETKDADIRDVIGFIAEESGVNLVMSDDVQGKISLRLRRVPWDQALIIVMRAKNLGYIRQGNVLRISQLASLQKEAADAQAIVQSQKGLSPLKVKVIPISYAQIKDLTTQIKEFLTPNRGKVVGDERTSALIVTDTNDVLTKIERLVKELDIPPTQVMIEGKIVEATETFQKDVGLNWGFTGANTTISASGGDNGRPIDLNFGYAFQPFTNDAVSALANAFNLRVGRMSFLGNLSSTLALAEKDNLVRIISSPRIVTMNKSPAEITQKGETISIKQTKDPLTDEITKSSTRVPVKLELKVTPQITAEGSVILDVEVLREFAGAEADQDTKDRPVNSRSAKTKVLVQNGQTAVIGGIYQSDETQSESGFPGLRKVPVLGWLFKADSKKTEKNELLLFLTPRILNPEAQTAKGS